MMKSPHARRHRPFVTLPRHRRSDLVIRLKGMIRRDAAEYGGRFTSRMALSEPPDLYSQWFDFHFPGSDRFTLWNAEMITARRAFWDTAYREAFARAAGQLDTSALESETKPEFEPATVSRTGKVLTCRMVERDPVRYAQFDGLTFPEQIDRLKAQIIRDEPPVIHESFCLDCSYAYGIGLRIVLNVEVIDRAAIETAIDRFLAIGEADWQSAVPVHRDRLPAMTEEEAWAAIGHPSTVQARAVR